MESFKQLADYPSIKKLAAALWRQDANRHGAAIMVGAGFSRCSATHVDGQKKLPLWQNFAKRLVVDLDPKNKDLIFTDPLRLAEEYRAYFGQAALNDLIRAEIHDAAWQPGELHKTLLNLPWSEVMTTNWDTLLERASLSIDTRIYGAVTKQTDLACFRSPRIVKLHGTVGISESFVVAQEDYRLYPQTSAAFVNFARQVFIENELCLIGFSGDDPNFLQWAGWVRDHLADHARKIYLVGALNLSAAKKKHLECLNITPIDLWSCVDDLDDLDLKHKTALEIFLSELKELKPMPSYEWTPTSLHRSNVTTDEHQRIWNDPSYAASILAGQVSVLSEDRKTYPDWLVCPSKLRWRINSQIHDPEPTAKNLEFLAPDVRTKLLYEMAWRYAVAFEIVPRWIIEAFTKIADPDVPSSLTKTQQLEIALLVLKNTRWYDTNETPTQELIAWAVSVLNKHKQYLPDSEAEVAYHFALVARDAFDFKKLKELIPAIRGEDPVWKMRRASLLGELGEYSEGKQLFSDAYRELLERQRHDPNSIKILSRLTWAHWLVRGTGKYWMSNEDMIALPHYYRDWLCDPWVHIDNLREKLFEKQEKHLKAQEKIEPLFEPGHYRDHSRDKRYSNETQIILTLEGLTSSVGLPLSWSHTNFLRDHAERLVTSDSVGDELLSYTWAIRASSNDDSDLLKNVFSRLGLACASQHVVDILLVRITDAIGFFRQQRIEGSEEQKNHAVNQLRVFLEVYARLLVRATPEESKSAFRLVAHLCLEPWTTHRWLMSALDNLVEYSLNSVPKSEHHELLIDALMFPLASEVGLDSKYDIDRWPNPWIEFLGSRNDDPRLARRIGVLIEVVLEHGVLNKSAFSRLQFLAKGDFLSKAESEKLAKKLWSVAPSYPQLLAAEILPHQLLLMPALDQTEANLMIREYIYKVDDISLFTQFHLVAIINAATNSTTRLLPASGQAIGYFDRLVAWRPSSEKDDFLGYAAQERNGLIDRVGLALTYAIVPALGEKCLTLERFESLAKFQQTTNSNASLGAFVHFACVHESTALQVERLLRKGMQSNESNDVSFACQALLTWVELCSTKGLKPPTGLIASLVYQIELGRPIGLQHLLWTAGEMIKNAHLTEHQLATVIEILPNLYERVDYQNIDPKGRDAVSASSIRAGCARLASCILKLTRLFDRERLETLISSAKLDALPEVRFATQPEEVID